MFRHHTRPGGFGPKGYFAMWGDRGPRGGGRGRGFGGNWGDGMEGGGGRRGRMFDPGELRLVLLKLLEAEPRHGYDLIRDIEERTGGAYAPSPGVVYPTLTLLDDMELIEETKTGGAKKLYAITETGRAQLAEKADEVDALLNRLEAVRERRMRGDRVSVGRAMGNLGMVLANKFGRSDIDDDTLNKIVALIDEAAGRIERL